MRTGLRVCGVMAIFALVALGGAKVRKLEPRDVAAMQAGGAKIIFLDARKGVSTNRIEGSVHVPPDGVDAWAATADAAAVYVAYCT